jgi:hypothetical protein
VVLWKRVENRTELNFGNPIQRERAREEVGRR